MEFTVISLEIDLILLHLLQKKKKKKIKKYTIFFHK